MLAIAIIIAFFLVAVPQWPTPLAILVSAVFYIGFKIFDKNDPRHKV